MKIRHFSLSGIILFAVACATAPLQPAVPVTPLTPGPSERVTVDRALILVDSSSSIGRRPFADEKQQIESFVGSMPDGSYEAGTIAFGGYRRDEAAMASFDRTALAAHAAQLSYLGEGTPVYSVLEEATPSFAGKGGRAAIFLFTDGVPSDAVGRDVDPSRTLEAASDLASANGGEVCFHTVQIGEDPVGAEFLRQLAATTSCGSFRNAASLSDAGAYHDFQRAALLGAVPVTAVAVVDGDSDADGVRDSKDECPGSPAGSKVDERGCWVLGWLNFASNSAELDADARRRLEDEVIPVLKRNPKLRLRVEGHTDSVGADAYNMSLSERRAEAVRSFLVSQGIAAGRLEADGFGETRPIAANDSDANRRKNRRTELTVIR